MYSIKAYKIYDVSKFECYYNIIFKIINILVHILGKKLFYKRISKHIFNLDYYTTFLLFSLHFFLFYLDDLKNSHL